MTPPPPLRFSTMNFAFRRASKCWARMRASVSDSPPGARKDTMRTGRAGQASVCAPVPDAAPSAARASSRRPSRLNSAILHGPALDLEEPVEARGALRGLHFPIGASRAEERIERPLRQALVGLAHGLDH